MILKSLTTFIYKKSGGFDTLTESQMLLCAPTANSTECQKYICWLGHGLRRPNGLIIRQVLLASPLPDGTGGLVDNGTIVEELSK